MKLGFKEKCADLFLLLLLLLKTTIADQLHQVDHIMLDISKPILSNAPKTINRNETRIRAMCAAFYAHTPVWLQLWSPTSDDTIWSLVWQTQIKPRYANKSEEVITINYRDYSPAIKPEYRLGLVNHDVPGPIRGITRRNASILLSMDTLDTMTLPINLTSVKEFDGLKMNYDFALDVCNTTRCTEFWEQKRCLRSGQVVEAASSSEGFELFSEDMVLGLIIWNLVLSFVVICVLITIVCMCNTLQKRKKDVRRFDNKYRNLEVSSTAGTISTKGDDVMYTHGKSRHHDVAKSSTSRDSWVSTDGDKKKLHENDAMEY